MVKKWLKKRHWLRITSPLGPGGLSRECCGFEVLWHSTMAHHGRAQPPIENLSLGSHKDWIWNWFLFLCVFLQINIGLGFYLNSKLQVWRLEKVDPSENVLPVYSWRWREEEKINLRIGNAPLNDGIWYSNKVKSVRTLTSNRTSWSRFIDGRLLSRL